MLRQAVVAAAGVKVEQMAATSVSSRALLSATQSMCATGLVMRWSWPEHPPSGTKLR
jgi:hypothetical protein